MILSRRSGGKRKAGTGRGAVEGKKKEDDKITRKRMTARPPMPQRPPALLLLTGQPRSPQLSSASPLRAHPQVPMPKCNMQLRFSKLRCAFCKWMCNARACGFVARIFRCIHLCACILAILTMNAYCHSCACATFVVVRLSCGNHFANLTCICLECVGMVLLLFACFVEKMLARCSRHDFVPIRAAHNIRFENNQSCVALCLMLCHVLLGLQFFPERFGVRACKEQLWFWQRGVGRPNRRAPLARFNSENKQSLTSLASPLRKGQGTQCAPSRASFKARVQMLGGRPSLTKIWPVVIAIMAAK